MSCLYPTFCYDAAQNKAVRVEQDIVAFLRRLVYPYRPKDFATDLPALLCDIADVVEKDEHQLPSGPRGYRRAE